MATRRKTRSARGTDASPEQEHGDSKQGQKIKTLSLDEENGNDNTTETSSKNPATEPGKPNSASPSKEKDSLKKKPRMTLKERCCYTFILPLIIGTICWSFLGFYLTGSFLWQLERQVFFQEMGVRFESLR